MQAGAGRMGACVSRAFARLGSRRSRTRRHQGADGGAALGPLGPLLEAPLRRELAAESPPIARSFSAVVLVLQGLPQSAALSVINRRCGDPRFVARGCNQNGLNLAKPISNLFKRNPNLDGTNVALESILDQVWAGPAKTWSISAKLHSKPVNYGRSQSSLVLNYPTFGRTRPKSHQDHPKSGRNGVETNPALAEAMPALAESIPNLAETHPKSSR